MIDTMSGAYLDLAAWPRRNHFELFRGYDQPFFNVTADVRVSSTYRLCRDAGHSFFLATLYQSLCAANRTEEFRLRLRVDGVWRYDRVHAGSTLLRPDGTFGFGYFDAAPNFSEFQANGRAVIATVRAATELNPEDERDDLLHYSVLPWIHFTSFAHARTRKHLDSVPKIVFGKRYERAGESWMPVSIEVHHALVDGLHVAAFLDAFQEGLDAFQI
ncbi:MAG TPA: CatA-like O-acetyltransferase [Burkholderiales bacterium]|nr:CatA-like O-acetyltransferase [Burkholderiales bacterium]